jgi:protein phosphatase PTC7
MEKLEQIHQTLGDIDARVPDALRVALVLGYRVSSPTPAPGEDDEVTDFAASLLQPPAMEDGACDRGPTLMEHDSTAAAAAAALRIDWASCYLPLHDHDAHFGNAKAGVLGVADGVGAYAESGVDAGAFSRGLMTSASAEVAGLEPGVHVCPCALLERAYDETAASNAPGASTAVILSLAGNALEWAYIGDSAFAVLRGSRIVFLSTPQRHLTHTSPKRPHFSSSAAARRKQRLFSCDDPTFQLSAGKHSDRIADARAGQLVVRAGDVVVVGTDGLFDDILEEQLELAVQMGTKLGFSPKNMADIIAGVAYERSNQTTQSDCAKGSRTTLPF